LSEIFGQRPSYQELEVLLLPLTEHVMRIAHEAPSPWG
jgi:hypothetical protein